MFLISTVYASVYTMKAVVRTVPLFTPDTTPTIHPHSKLHTIHKYSLERLSGGGSSLVALPFANIYVAQPIIDDFAAERVAWQQTVCVYLW